jgi:alpha-L-fucosidase
MLQENIAKGQRVEKFKVELLIDGQWVVVGKGTTVGYKRLLRFSETAAEEVRVTIEECRRTAEIMRVGLFYCPELGANSNKAKEYFSSSAWVTLGNDGKKIFDNDVETVWKSKDMQPLIIDLTEVIKIKGVAYVPVEKVNGEGVITKYRVYTSLDGQTWQLEGNDREFENIRNNPIAQNVWFEKELDVRFLKIEPIETNDNNGTYSVAEFGVILGAL